MAYKYHFETNWKFEAEIEQIWKYISEFNYEEWWQGVTTEKIKDGQNGIGDVYVSVFRTSLPYKLSFTSEVIKIESPYYLELDATGELEGKGIWRLSQDGEITHVNYTWQVNTNKKWMNKLAPILRPAFEWNHDQVMNNGAKGLAKTLGVQLISY